MTGALALTLNGQLYHGEHMAMAKLDSAERGYLLADGLFETLPIWNNQIIWLQEHLDRLQAGLKSLGLDVPSDQCIKAIEPLQTIASENGGNAILRLTISRGSGGRGLLPPTTAIPTLLASLSLFPAGMAFADATLMTSSIRRNEGSPSSRLKSLTYLDNILATQQAEAKGAQDALLLNNQGKVCCSTIANIFAIFGQTIITPPLQDGILGGIMRQKLLEILPQHDISIKEQSLTLEQLKKADGLFLTNSLRIIRRVTHLDDQIFESAPDDLITQCQHLMRNHLQTHFQAKF